MRKLIFLLMLAAILVGGCATGGQIRPAERTREWPTGPGTIPPYWYGYDPAYSHWFDPWYINPYTAR